MRVDRGEGVVPEGEGEPFIRRRSDSLDDGLCRSAKWAFVVAVLQECDRSVHGPSNVVSSRRDGLDQLNAPIRPAHGRFSLLWTSGCPPPALGRPVPSSVRGTSRRRLPTTRRSGDVADPWRAVVPAMLAADGRRGCRRGSRAGVTPHVPTCARSTRRRSGADHGGSRSPRRVGRRCRRGHGRPGGEQPGGWAEFDGTILEK